MVMEMPETVNASPKRPVWNAGRTVSAKWALKPKQISEIRSYLNQRRRLRDRALFDFAIDSKIRGCNLVRMKIDNVFSGGQIRARAIVMQQKTGGLFNSNISLMPGPACWRGSSGGAAQSMIRSSQPGLITMVTSAHGNIFDQARHA